MYFNNYKAESIDATLYKNKTNFTSNIHVKIFNVYSAREKRNKNEKNGI